MRSRRNSPAEETILGSLLLVLIWFLTIGREHFGQLRLERLDVCRLRRYEVLLGWLGLFRSGIYLWNRKWCRCTATRLAREGQWVQKKNRYRLVRVHCDNRNTDRLLPTTRKLAALRCHFCGHLVPKVVRLGERLVQGPLPGELGGNNRSAGSDTRSSGKDWIALSFDPSHQPRGAILHQPQAGNRYFAIVRQDY